MTKRAIAIRLKIPDNEAYTALATLRRLGVAVEKIERSEVWIVDDGGDADTLATRVEANETIFNPNKHRLALLDSTEPRAGEAWIREIAELDEVREHLGGKRIPGITRAQRCTGWRLFDAAGRPAETKVVVEALDRLLFNGAIEIAYHRTGDVPAMLGNNLMIEVPGIKEHDNA